MIIITDYFITKHIYFLYARKPRTNSTTFRYETILRTAGWLEINTGFSLTSVQIATKKIAIMWGRMKMVSSEVKRRPRKVADNVFLTGCIIEIDGYEVQDDGSSWDWKIDGLECHMFYERDYNIVNGSVRLPADHPWFGIPDDRFQMRLRRFKGDVPHNLSTTGKVISVLCCQNDEHGCIREITRAARFVKKYYKPKKEGYE